MSQSFSGGDRRDRQAALLDGWLSSLMPGARILIVRPAADRRTATVVSDHGSPCTEGAKLHFPPGALARALASGAHIVRCAADVPAGRSHPAPFRYRERAELLIVPRPTEARGRQIAAVVLPRERHRALQSERLLRTAMRQWKSHFASMARELAKWTPIMRAKQEWESTVDALPEVICLIDSEQRVLRANRAVERWGLGSVKSVLGTPLHSLFHPACDGVDCALLNSLTELCSAHWKVGSAALEFEARVGEKTVLLQVRPMPPAGALDLPPVIHAIFVATDVTALRSAQQELRALNDELEYRIADRTHELMEANGDLREQVGRRIEAEQALVTSRNELSMLSVELMRAQESERKRIAQELHDAVGQSLSAIKYALERAIHLGAHPALGDPAAVLRLAVATVQNTIDEVRSISMNLHPPVLDDMGAASAVRWLCREWARVYAGVRVDLELEVIDEEVPQALGTAVFRTVQEALNNVAKHAAARVVTVSLLREGDSLIVEVNDDGVGSTVLADHKLPMTGHGLRGMRERAENAGGHFVIASEPGRGTMLRVRWPVVPKDAKGEFAPCV